VYRIANIMQVITITRYTKLPDYLTEKTRNSIKSWLLSYRVFCFDFCTGDIIKVIDNDGRLLKIS
jgi:hypothetical protein